MQQLVQVYDHYILSTQTSNNSLLCSNKTKGQDRTEYLQYNPKLSLDRTQSPSILDPIIMGRVFLVPYFDPIEQFSTLTFISLIVDRELHLYPWYQIESLVNPYRSFVESLGRILSITIWLPYRSPYQTPIEYCPIVDRVPWQSSECVAGLFRIPPIVCHESPSIADRSCISGDLRLIHYSIAIDHGSSPYLFCRQLRIESLLDRCPIVGRVVTRSLSIAYRVVNRSWNDWLSSSLSIMIRRW